MSWFFLFIAGVFEIAWAYFMKTSQGFTRLTPSILMLICAFSSFGFLSAALKNIPMGTAYAVWTGIGAVGAATLGILFFNEPQDWKRLVSLFFVIMGIVGLKVFSPS